MRIWNRPYLEMGGAQHKQHVIIIIVNLNKLKVCFPREMDHVAFVISSKTTISVENRLPEYVEEK